MIQSLSGWRPRACEDDSHYIPTPRLDPLGGFLQIAEPVGIEHSSRRVTLKFSTWAFSKRYMQDE